jgi:hypothetical protein
MELLTIVLILGAVAIAIGILIFVWKKFRVQYTNANDSVWRSYTSQDNTSPNIKVSELPPTDFDSMY